ncbi:MAG: binding-protein-dependent transport system inner rane component [Pseudonocardia sp.]|jgi:multiple sugar transport system permease protein|nr:binding-protein-dependent transport system inner rane component [Pseudonocardia sp.]
MTSVPTLRALVSRGLLAVAAMLAVLPVLFLVSLSLRGTDDVQNGGWLPERLLWANWPAAFETVPLARMLANSWLVAVGATLLTAVIAVPTAYVTARAGRRGKRLYSVLLAAYCAPPVVAVLPLYFLLKSVDLTNSTIGLALVNGLANVPVAVWLLDGFVRRVPVEVEEAAWVDGLSVASGLRRIVFPLITPGLVAASLVCFFLAYNEFLFAVSFSQSAASQTLTVGLSLFQGDRTVQFGQQAAASLVAIVPVYVLAVLAQRSLVAGLSQGAVK